jgi:hypothetical protein
MTKKHNYLNRPYDLLNTLKKFLNARIKAVVTDDRRSTTPDDDVDAVASKTVLSQYICRARDGLTGHRYAKGDDSDIAVVGAWKHRAALDTGRIWAAHGDWLRRPRPRQADGWRLILGELGRKCRKSPDKPSVLSVKAGQSQILMPRRNIAVINQLEPQHRGGPTFRIVAPPGL